MLRFFLILSALAGACAAGADERPVLFHGQPGFVLAGPDNAARDARVFYLQELKQFSKKGLLDSDAAKVGQIVAIAVRLKNVAVQLFPESAGWDWDIHVATSKVVNAWCMPGGKMLVYSALIEPFARDDAAIAFAIGHEISHALLEHGRTRQDRELFKSGVHWLLTRAFRVGSVGSSGLSAGEEFSKTLPMSRGAELEADTLGVELMSRAGYAPEGALRMIAFLAAQAEEGAEKTDFTATHPLHERRIANIRQLLPAAGKLLPTKGAR